MAADPSLLIEESSLSLGEQSVFFGYEFTFVVLGIKGSTISSVPSIELAFNGLQRRMVGSFSAAVRTSEASVSVFAWRYSWLVVADVVRTGERGSAFCIRW